MLDVAINAAGSVCFVLILLFGVLLKKGLAQNKQKYLERKSG